MPSSRLLIPRIHQAVLQKNMEAVRRLLHRKKKSRINQPDSLGATPLMLAALVGSPKIVTFLLEKGASWQKRDNAGCVASQYVLEFHDQKMANYKAFYYRVSTSIHQRRHIRQHLSAHSVLESQYRTKRTGTLTFQRRGCSLKISKLIAKVTLPSPISEKATTACIAPGASLRPEMCAVSGWTVINSPGILDGRRYTQLVRDMAKLLDFELPRRGWYDGKGSLPENEGRFSAAHSEKLLAAYWVTEQLQLVFGSRNLTRMEDLKTANLPRNRRMASLYLDHRPCISCRLFLGAIQDATGLQITAFPQELVRPVSRGENRSEAAAATTRKTNRSPAEVRQARESTPVRWQRFPGEHLKPRPVTPLLENPFEAHEEAMAPSSSTAERRKGGLQNAGLLSGFVQQSYSAQRSESELADPTSFQEGSSAYFGAQANEHPMAVSRASSKHCAESQSPEQSALSRLSKARKQRLQKVASQLRLRERFAFRPQQQLRQTSGSLKKPTMGRASTSSTTTRRTRELKLSKEQRMASRSTLLHNVKYREILRQSAADEPEESS